VARAGLRTRGRCRARIGHRRQHRHLQHRQHGAAAALPFEEPDRIVRLFQVPPQATFPGMSRFSVSPANFYDWKRDARLVEEMALYRLRPFALTGGRSAESVLAGAVGAGFFEVLRARPALGRVFLAEEDAPGRSRVVILSDGLWKRHFGARSC
jgi:hypothetical protein